jgi:multidrug efflux pump subunit AcrB
MIKFLLSRPIAVIMVFIAAMVLGVISYQTLPISLMPDIPIPEITVQVNYKNSTARELENVAVKSLRMQLLQVAHLADIKSETRDGIGIIHLKFDYGTNIDYAYIETNEKIDASMNGMPRDMERPRVIKTSATDIPVFYLNLSLKQVDPLNSQISDNVSDKFIELSEFAESVIRKRIEQLPEVAMVDVSGTVSSQLTVEPDINKMTSLNLTVADIENILVQNNLSPSNFMVRDGFYQYNIRFSSILRTRDDVGNIFIKSSDKIMRLRDVAKISIGTQKRTGMFASNGKPAITMAVIKQADARMSDMKDQIAQIVKQFETDYPDVHFESSQDQTQLLDYSISNLKQNLTQGLILVTLIVFLFLKDIKTPILIGLTLIVSIIVCMLFFKLVHLSVNIISLAGLILAAGNMIDNSIVVTDNITQYRERGFSINKACITGTNEVMIPMLSSMLTNVAVFIPLIFLSGIAGALLYDEAISVTIGLVVSYIVGITLMPVIYMLFNSGNGKKIEKIEFLKEQLLKHISRHSRKFFNLEQLYEKGMNLVFKHKKTTLYITLLTLPLTFLLFWVIKKEKMPSFKQTEVFVNIDWNENIHVGENKLRVFNMLNSIQAPVKQSNSFIGTQQFMINRDQELGVNEARVYIKTGSQIDVDSIQVQTQRFFTAKYPKAKYSFEPPVSIFEKLFSTGESPLVAEVSSANKEMTIKPDQINNLCKKLNNNPILNSKNEISFQENMVINVDMERLLLYNVNYDMVIRELKTAFKENYVGELRSSQHQIPIVIIREEKLVSQILSELTVINNSNTQIPVNNIIHISRSNDFKSISAGKEGEIIPLSFFPSSNNQMQYENEIRETVQAGKNFDVKFSGSLISGKKFIAELMVILCISVLLLYFIMAAQFESLVQPLLVILEIPIDIGAALLFMYIFGQSLNLMSAIGMVIMTGIVINDSILKLDVINQLRKEGHPLMDAIKIGGHRRLRAILMTGLTSVLAMVPLLWGSDMGSELQKPFSISLIGGMIVGTFVSLFIVPLFYWFIYRNEVVKN